MQYMDCVQVIVEKEKYAKNGIHKGMYGWICMEERYTDNAWLVNFPLLGTHTDIATDGIKESDMRVVPVMYAVENERIRVECGEHDASNPDTVELIVEKECYARHGLHKGMQGWTYFEQEKGLWLIYFPKSEMCPDEIADIPISVTDFKRIPRITPGINEKIAKERGE